MKLTKPIILEIVRRHKEDGIPYTHLAKEYNVDNSTIYKRMERFGINGKKRDGRKGGLLGFFKRAK